MNIAEFFTGDSGLTNTSESLTLSYNLTLDGVTHTVSQSAIWTIDPTLDTFVSAAASNSVLFNLGSQGSYLVTLDGYTLFNPVIGNTDKLAVMANFQAVPEPAAAALLAFALLAIGIQFRRRLVRASTQD